METMRVGSDDGFFEHRERGKAIAYVETLLQDFFRMTMWNF